MSIVLFSPKLLKPAMRVTSPLLMASEDARHCPDALVNLLLEMFRMSSVSFASSTWDVKVVYFRFVVHVMIQVDLTFARVFRTSSPSELKLMSRIAIEQVSCSNDDASAMPPWFLSERRRSQIALDSDRAL